MNFMAAIRVWEQKARKSSCKVAIYTVLVAMNERKKSNAYSNVLSNANTQRLGLNLIGQE